MPEGGKISITVKIGDRSYTMSIRPDQEYAIRESANEINRALEENFDRIGRTDYPLALGMLALDLSMRLRDKDTRKENEAEQIGQLRELRKMIQQGVKNGEKPHN